jgi:hypothetical protein
MDAGAIVGGFIGLIALYILGDILVGLPGLIIYSALFTRREYNPDAESELDTHSIQIRITGVVFWALVIGLIYGIYRFAA